MRSDEPLLSHHRRRVVERLAEACEDLVDLAFADDQRRAERDDVAGHVAQNHAMVLRASDEVGANGSLRVEALLARLVAYELDRTDQADAARVPYQRVVGIAPQTLL